MTVLLLTFSPPPTVVRELGREGILPFASFFASNRPFNAPLAGLLTQYIVSCIFLFAIPPGDIYIFLINCKSGIPSVGIILRLKWIIVSVILFIVSYQRLGVVWSVPLIHAIISDLGLEPSFPGPKGYHLHISPVQYFFGYCAILSPSTRNNDLRKTSVLGTFYFCSSIFSLTHVKKSHTQLAVSPCLWLALHIGLYGVSGFPKRKDIVSNMSWLFKKMVSLNPYSVGYLDLLLLSSDALQEPESPNPSSF